RRGSSRSDPRRSATRAARRLAALALKREYAATFLSGRRTPRLRRGATNGRVVTRQCASLSEPAEPLLRWELGDAGTNHASPLASSVSRIPAVYWLALPPALK